MRKLLRITTAILVLAMCLSMSSCGSKELSDDIKVGTLIGPTGMGLINLQDNEKIDLELYQNPTDVVQKLISGDVDIACLPSNMGGMLYAKTKGNIQIMSTIVNGVLYIVENGKSVQSLEDLKGKIIYGSGKGGTPEYVLQALLEDAGLQLGKDVQVEWLDSHATVAQKVASTQDAIGLLPEPQVSAITLKSDRVKIALDINELWKNLTKQELPMGILIAKKRFLEERAADVEILMDAVYSSIEDVQTESDEVVQKIVDAGIIPDAVVCKAAIPRCSLVCYSGDQTKQAIDAFYEKMFAVEPTSIGGAIPTDDIYWRVNK